jgi:hypothetical protein
MLLVYNDTSFTLFYIEKYCAETKPQNIQVFLYHEN